MTYSSSSNAVFVTDPAQIFLSKVSFSGNLSTNDYINIDAPIYDNTFDVTRNSDNLVLGRGYYLLECAIGVNMGADVANYIDYKVEKDGVLIGNESSTAQLNKSGVDQAHATFSVDTSAVVKIKITNVAGTISVNTDYSSLVLRKVKI